MKKVFSRTQVSLASLALIATLFSACQKGTSSNSNSSKAASSQSAFDKNLQINNELNTEESFSLVQESTLEKCASTVEMRSCPLSDQGQSSWCSAFAITKLLSQVNHDGNVSVMHYAALNNDGQDIHFFDLMTHGELALEKIQKNRSILSDESLPFDSLLVNTLKKELINFFDNGQLSPEATAKENSITGYYYKLKLNLAELSNLKTENKDLKSFLSSFKVKSTNLERTDGLETVIQMVQLPPFRYSKMIANQSSSDEFFSKVFDVMSDGTFVSYLVCASQMDPNSNSKDCGLHQVNLVDKRLSPSTGECEVLVNNSWGENWGDNGNQWYSLKDLIQLSPNFDGQSYFTALYLKELSEDSNSQDNEIHHFINHYVYRGETSDGKSQGKGRTDFDNGTFREGTFKEGTFVEGRGSFFTTSKNGKKLKREGSLKNIKGVLTLDGENVTIEDENYRLIFSGTMINGYYSSGEYNTYYDTDSHDLKTSFIGSFQGSNNYKDGDYFEYDPNAYLLLEYHGTFNKSNQFLDGTLTKRSRDDIEKKYTVKNGKSSLIKD